MTVDELITLANGQITNTPPFAVYSPEVVQENGGPRTGSGQSEFNMLKDSIFYRNVEELRALTAEKFTKWRSAGGQKAGEVNIPPRKN